MEGPSLLENYVEPNYPIVRREYFDDDNMRLLLNDDKFNRNDRNRLSNYNRHRLSGSIVNVEYKLADDVNEYRLGRLYPTDGIGLQSYRFDMRNPLTKKHHFDVDAENCHICIAEKKCKEYELPHQYISYYINNRDLVLQSISNDRKTAKTEILKILYGGEIKLYNQYYENQIGEIKQEGLTILQNLKVEFNRLQDEIWIRNSHLHKIKIGGKVLDKKPNKKASLMALIFQTSERKLLMMVDYVMKEKYNRSFSVLIHDGGLILKNEGETTFPIEILDDVSRIVTSHTGIKTRLIEKPIEYDWVHERKLSPYETMKLEFEKKYYYIGSKIVQELDNGELLYMSVTDLRNKNKNLHWIEEDNKGNKIKKYFTDEWLEDKTRADYERLDFIPNMEKCPKNVYNRFKGFEAEKLANEFLSGTMTENDISKSEIEELIQPILKHINLLCGGDDEFALFFLKVQAGIIQHPEKKSEVLIVFRDTDGLLEGGGGNGKSLYLVNFLCYKIIGEKYSCEIHDNADLYSSFNSQYSGKLVGVIEECGDGEHHRNENKLKNYISSTKRNVNTKGVQQYTMNDYLTFFGNTNVANPLPIKIGNRRIAIVDVDNSMRGDKDYFKTLSECMENKRVQYYFYLYLKFHIKSYNSPVEYQINIPKNKTYRELLRLNAPLHIKWICYKVETNTLNNDSMRNLYLDYVSWIKENREAKDDNKIMSETSFGIILKRDGNVLDENDEHYCLLNIGNKTKTRGIMKYKWNIENVVSSLKKLYLLSENFEYDFDDNSTENEL